MKAETSLRALKGVGEKTEKLFARLGIYTKEQLLGYYPRDYDIYREPVQISELTTGEKQAVSAAVVQASVKSLGAKKSIVTARVRDESGTLTVNWFNMPYLRTTLKKGSRFILRGLAVEKGGRFVLEQPEIFTPASYQEKLHAMQPVYGLTAGLTNKMVTKLVAQILEEEPERKEYLPEEIRMEYKLAESNFAVRQIHFPRNMESFLAARDRLAFDEFFLFILALRRMKEKAEGMESPCPMEAVWKTEEVVASLPYQMTRAQQKVWSEIENDLKSSKRMARLVQGDVGSGKTILAFLAMIMTAENGCQSALMVPTEVLANQHYQALCSLLDENDLLEEYRPVLLTGSMSQKEKRRANERISLGLSRMIIGTHALIQAAVDYDHLTLVITDEQHRFGVNQREQLTGKGEFPNVLVMSATPIPRTLAIILYGNLDISVIDELPARRLPIKNCVVGPGYRPAAYRFMEKEIRAGHQVYVICPMVEESEGLDAENVLDYREKLRGIFPEEIRIEALHGQMRPAVKQEIMEAFAAGEIQILVSTTVVEVGVNVPNATVMMIENAERFGLAQLHQLRGRVGRGKDQSYCIFVQGKEDEKKKSRLEILNKSNDGFAIAAEDLKLRGPGDLFGFRQSGLLEFSIGDIYRDSDLLKKAGEAAGMILALDEPLELSCHRELKKKLEGYMEREVENLGL